MIESFIHFIHVVLIPLGWVGVFMASIIEEVIAIIPSALVIFGSGFLLVKGPITLHSLLMLFLKVAVPAALGVTIGSLVVYYAAFFAGKPLLEKWGKWIGLTWEDIDNMSQKFSQTSFDEMSLFVARAIPIIPSVVISAFCGLIRFPLRSYLIYSFLGLVIRACVLGFVGWQIGSVYVHYASLISKFEDLIILAVVIAGLGFILYRRHKKQSNLVQ